MTDQELTYPDHVGDVCWRWSSSPSCTVESTLDAVSMAICGNNLDHRSRQEAKNILAWLQTDTVYRWYTGGGDRDNRKKAFCTLLSHLLTECSCPPYTRKSGCARLRGGFHPFLLPSRLTCFRKKCNHGLTPDLFTGSVECRLC